MNVAFLDCRRLNSSKRSAEAIMASRSGGYGSIVVEAAEMANPPFSDGFDQISGFTCAGSRSLNLS
ncbi:MULTISPECIES: hypothetical protein [unclassified Ectothiorhodospira]|jgi:hypothetical protein|uniref:hypothetical protein n=1 Tax=unclassified Ectothiorhodospira TaxID=2684909 RepID=UPI001EE88AD9|nr:MULTISPECIES: hypothetical protein [unclassified Ectothiorhodospira]MCG5515554.1 hypothetical protein [Ectothiorhodospira sp. 9100]MCG5518713.1 hypothetical protein [Ectothiorhodospira sp. 9905]